MPGSGYQVGVVPEWMAQAETLEELCEKLGIDADGLNATLTVFNENAENGGLTRIGIVVNTSLI